MRPSVSSLVVGLVAVIALGGCTEDLPDDPAPTETTPPATVTKNGNVLGPTPIDVDWALGETGPEIVLTAEGHVARTLRLTDADRGQTRDLALEKVAEKPVEKPVEPAATTPKVPKTPKKPKDDGYKML